MTNWQYLEVVDKTSLTGIATNGGKAVAVPFPSLPPDLNMKARLVKIRIRMVSGTAITAMEGQVWRKKNADHWTNKDNDVEESVWKTLNAVTAAPWLIDRPRGAERDFENRDAVNIDTVTDEKNRLYVGVKQTGGDTDTLYHLLIGIEVPM